MCAVWRVQPFFETGAAQYIKPSWLVLDLGSEQALEVLSGYEGVMRTPEELAKQGTYWHYSGSPGAIAKLKDKRLPPLVPEEFAARAESKALTNGKDKQVLLDLQKEVSTTVLRNVKELSFSGLGWGDDDAALLAKALSLCEDLRVLDLSQNRIGPTGASVLAPAAATRGSLTSCDVRHNAISGEGASQLAAAVLSNDKIEKFNEIPIKEMRADSLTELKLTDERIGIEGVMVVAGLMRLMASLTTLLLARNSLGAEGAKALAPAIAGSSSLTLVRAPWAPCFVCVCL